MVSIQLLRPIVSAAITRNLAVCGSKCSLVSHTKRIVPILEARRSLSWQNGPLPCYREKPGVVSLDCLKSMLEAEDIQLFDVREPNELEQEGKIPGSINLPGKIGAF